MKPPEVISQLSSSSFYAQCPSCMGEFKLSDATLFDGLGKFPEDAQARVKELEIGLKEWSEEIKKRKKRATEGAEKSAKVIGVGKNLEKLLPELKNFEYPLPDCRFLSDPIDLVVFNGCTSNQVRSISFVEVKSGNARLNQHQMQVKDAIEDKRVKFKVMK